MIKETAVMEGTDPLNYFLFIFSVLKNPIFLSISGCGLLNLSNKQIRKLDKTVLPTIQTGPVISLNASGNCLQRLDNIDLFPELVEVSKNETLFIFQKHKRWFVHYIRIVIFLCYIRVVVECQQKSITANVQFK